MILQITLAMVHSRIRDNFVWEARIIYSILKNQTIPASAFVSEDTESDVLCIA